jgi:SSS family transporter
VNYLDWVVIIIYIVIIIGIALYLTRKQHDIQDYYLAGKKIKWWQSGVSTMATQLGAISFISAPAFVAMKDGGGLKWLSYEFGVPLALILVMAVIIPTLHRHNYISIYEYLENRFDSDTRSLVSFLFQLGRGLATAVSVLAGGLILSTALSISTASAIILIGVITMIYDVIGGIRVVILSDVLQMIIIVVGIVISGGVALYLVGWDTAWSGLSPERFQILDFKRWGASPEGSYAFWPMTIGGFFLYASYYGTDQSQVQRELTVGSVNDVRKSLMVNALGRFPLVLMYSLMGVFIGAIFASPESLTHVASAMNMETTAVSQLLERDPDRMVPLFIFSYLPNGLIGFIFVAIMAALMSSLDSGLNSLSAVTMRDFYQKYIRKESNDRQYLIASKIITLFWGIFCITAALIFAGFGQATRQTTIVLINAVGSMLYGPILAAFLLGMFTKNIGPRAVKLGVLFGILINIYLWIFTPFSWLWWNFTGFAAAVVTAFLASVLWRSEKGESLAGLEFVKEKGTSSRKWTAIYKLVVLYFILIIIISYLIQKTGVN